jgi:acyl dehydratase
MRLVTGTRSAPDAMTADLFVHIPLAKKGPRGPREPKVVPADATEIAALDIDARAGLDFALLTGDFNPIHWIRPYARAAGFRSTILHGFGTLARTVEALNRARFSGNPALLTTIDARFVKPLVLPARVFVYTTADGGLFVGDAPSGDAAHDGAASGPKPRPPAEAYLEGRFTTETSR